MLSSLSKRLISSPQCLRWFRTAGALPPPRNRPPRSRPAVRNTADEKSEWWIVDGEIHEIGENVPPRERFAIPRNNFPNKHRKRLREQFMRRTRLVLKESQHEHWCNTYIELYQELRENWERLYWDEGYSKKVARDNANYDSSEDDDNKDFSPYRSRPSYPDRLKRLRENRMKWSVDSSSLLDQGYTREQGQGGTLQQVNMIRDKFEHDREKRMRDRAFAPMRGGPTSGASDSNHNQQFDVHRYFPPNEGR